MPTTRIVTTRMVAAAGLVLSAAGLMSAAHAAPPDSATAGAGGFLARELAAGNGTLPYPGTDQADIGVTSDAVLGMLATGVGPDEAATALTAIEAASDSYLGPGLAPTELYAGPVAKTILVAAAMDRDPAAFAGRDLIADLSGLEGADGHYADRTAYGDTSNTFTQALGVLADFALDGAVSDKPVDFLVAQQCSDGGFRLYVTETACVSDPDATAMAAMALRHAPEQPAVVDAALGYLRDRTTASGGIPGGTGAETPNSNTTGLAAAAFAGGGAAWAAEFAKARGFLTALQFDCAAGESLRGAVAYDQAGYDALVAQGPDAQATDQERRASAQAALGLAGLDPAEVTLAGATAPDPDCSGPTGSPTSPSPTSPSPTSTSPTSTTPASPSSSPASTTSTTSTTGTASATSPAANPTVTITTTLPVPVPAVAPPPYRAPGGAPSVTEPATARSETSTEEPGTATAATASASAAATTTGPLPTSTTPVTTPGATTVAAAGSAPADSGTSGGPLAIAAGLVLLGATGAGLILRRGRSH